MFDVTLCSPLAPKSLATRPGSFKISPFFTNEETNSRTFLAKGAGACAFKVAKGRPRRLLHAMSKHVKCRQTRVYVLVEMIVGGLRCARVLF